MQDIIGQQNKLPGRLTLFVCDVGLIEWKSYPQKAKDQNLISSVLHLGVAFALRPSVLGVYLVIYGISSESIDDLTKEYKGKALYFLFTSTQYFFSAGPRPLNWKGLISVLYLPSFAFALLF